MFNPYIPALARQFNLDSDIFKISNEKYLCKTRISSPKGYFLNISFKLYIELSDNCMSGMNGLKNACPAVTHSVSL